jgi:hypothetical protein
MPAAAGCPRIPYWSNARVQYKAEATGTPAADNARLVLELAERVSIPLAAEGAASARSLSEKP